MIKTKPILLITIFALIIMSCATKKNISEKKLYGTTWELEYISEPRIAFDGLYHDKKPKISFNKEKNQVSGNNSCNGYTADYTLTSNSIFFGEPGPSTMMFCGEGEKVFLNMIKKINKYNFDHDGKLNLMIDDVSMMRFKKTDTSAISDSAESKQTTIAINQMNAKTDEYFQASGTEPFWSLELSEEHIKLKTITDSIITPYKEPLQAMDSNVKMYAIETGSNQLNIQITQSECTNAMSGKVSPYKVFIEYKHNAEPSLHILKGCGTYKTDYRLHDIWVLEKLNGKNMGKTDFNNDLPLIEINSTTNTFTGFAGCNRMNGKLYCEKNLLRFIDIATTKMMCDSNNNENAFLSALRSATTYKIENNRLLLSNLIKELLIFKKID